MDEQEQQRSAAIEHRVQVLERQHEARSELIQQLSRDNAVNDLRAVDTQERVRTLELGVQRISVAIAEMSHTVGAIRMLVGLVVAAVVAQGAAFFFGE